MIYITTYLLIGVLICFFTERMVQNIINDPEEDYDIPPMNTPMRLRLITIWPFILFMSFRDWLLRKPL